MRRAIDLLALAIVALFVGAWTAQPRLHAQYGAQYGANFGSQLPGYQNVQFSPGQIANLKGWWRSDLGITLGTNGTTATGTTPPAVTFTGTPVGTVGWTAATTSIEIDITTLGALGTALFTWKMLGVTQATGQTTAATFALGSTGLTANFPTGTYAANNVYTTQVAALSWADQSTVGTTLIQAIPTRYPAWTSADTNYAGKPSLTNSTTLSFLGATFASTVAAPYTVLVVYKRATTSTSEQALIGDTGSAWAVFSYPYFAQPGWNTTGSASLLGPSGSSNDTNVHAMALVFGASGAIYLDSSSTPIVTGAASTTAANGMESGYAGGIGASILNSSTTEILLYSGALTSAQLASIFQYFSARYGVNAATVWPDYVVDTPGEYAAQPHVIKLSNGTLFATYRSGIGPGQLGKGTIVSRTSTTGGLSWSAESAIYSDATYDTRDPCVTQLANGTLMVSFFEEIVGGTPLTNAVYEISSANLGTSWGAPVQVPSAASAWEASSAPVVQLGNGNLLQPVYANNGNADSSRVVISTDGGATWPTEVMIADGDVYGYEFDEPNVLLLASGTLVDLIRTDSWITKGYSLDGGHTWSTPTGSTPVIQGESAPHMTLLASGRIVTVVRSTLDTYNRTGTSASLDGGTTWEISPTLFAGQPNAESEYGAPIELVPGIVGAIFATYQSSTLAVIQFTAVPESGT